MRFVLFLARGDVLAADFSLSFAKLHLWVCGMRMCVGTFAERWVRKTESEILFFHFWLIRLCRFVLLLIRTRIRWWDSRTRNYCGSAEKIMRMDWAQCWLLSKPKKRKYFHFCAQKKWKPLKSSNFITLLSFYCCAFRFHIGLRAKRNAPTSVYRNSYYLADRHWKSTEKKQQTNRPPKCLTAVHSCVWKIN